jgi:hypothetical protein
MERCASKVSHHRHLAQKDNRLVLAAAEASGVPLASLVHDRFQDG